MYLPPRSRDVTAPTKQAPAAKSNALWSPDPKGAAIRPGKKERPVRRAALQRRQVVQDMRAE